ncbi:MAG: tetratricopeptide repeat protein [Cyanobacteria bacterium P01_D01_bin.14]
MSTAAAFQSGIDAVKAGRFSEAIQTLEALCDGKVKPPSKAYYQVKMGLVRAYRGNGQLPEAIKLCRQLATSSHPKVQQWAQEMLPELRNPASLSSSEPLVVPQAVAEPVAVVEPAVAASSEPPAGMPANDAVSADATAGLSSEPLAPAAAEALLTKGVQAFRRKRYDEAIEPLRQFVQGADPLHPNLGYAQTSLAKVYAKTERVEDAIALCKTMIDSPNEGAKAWAKQFLSKHDVRPEPEAVAETDPVSVPPEASPPDTMATSSVQTAARSIKAPSEQASSVPATKDYGVLVLSATCYAAYYFGAIYSFLFPSNLYGDGPMMVSPAGALLFGLMNWLGPIIVSGAVLGLSKNRIARANAKESINLWITSVVVAIGAGLLVLGLFLFPLLALLAFIAVVPLIVIFYVAPLIALIMCVVRPFEPFRIPLIWHILE